MNITERVNVHFTFMKPKSSWSCLQQPTTGFCETVKPNPHPHTLFL